MYGNYHSYTCMWKWEGDYSILTKIYAYCFYNVIEIFQVVVVVEELAGSVMIQNMITLFMI